MLTLSFTLHAPDGRLLWIQTLHPIKVHDPVGTLPWEWFDPKDRERLKANYGLALMGEVGEEHRYRLNPDHYGDGWTIALTWHPTKCAQCPVAAVSKVFNSVVESLSKREREVAKLLPELGSKQIASKLGITKSTVETLRQRLAGKVGFHGSKLIAWCSALSDVI